MLPVSSMSLKRGFLAAKFLINSSVLDKYLVKRCLSSGLRHDIRQGGSLYIDALSRGVAHVEVVSQWQDHIEVHNSEKFETVVDKESQVMSIQ